MKRSPTPRRYTLKNPPRETVEDVMRMGARVARRMNGEGVRVRFKIEFEDCEPNVIWQPLYDFTPKKKRRGVKR